MKKDERIYWIWLQQAFGPGSPKPMKIHRQYPGGVKEFCLGGPRLWNSRRDLSDKEAVTLRDFSVSQAQARLEYAEKLGWWVVTPGCEKYPPLLTHISDPPAVLYGKGTLPDWNDALPISIAGSRKAAPESLDAARRIGYELAAGGACVVSGGAEGIDSAALNGAITLPGAKVVSVLPVSLDSNYVMKNAGLRRTICERGGALLTEYFAQPAPLHGTFPMRNRLITGISKGIVLIQAAQKSGTMLYAGHALDQNRDVFVYPGPEGDARFAGGRELLSDGAIPVTCGEDVLAEYGGARPEQREAVTYLFDDLLPAAEASKTAALADAAAGLSPAESAVLNALSTQPLSVAELEDRTGLSTAELFSILTALELEGLADSLPGKRYRAASRRGQGYTQ